MKNLILCCLVTFSLITLAACSDSTPATTTTTTQSAAMAPDAKSMQTAH